MTTAMKSELRDVGACRKELAVEIPATTVDAAIERISRRYGRSVKVQGFRPGKVPARVVRARFHAQILRDVAQDLIPEAVDEAVAEHELQPVATPRSATWRSTTGKPLTFTALIETVPEVDPGDYSAFTLRQKPVTVDAGTVEQAVERLRQGRAQLEPVTERPAERGRRADHRSRGGGCRTSRARRRSISRGCASRSAATRIRPGSTTSWSDWRRGPRARSR